MSEKLNKFKEVLREVFQMDQADLDFGIYRIMNQKRDEIEKFLDQDLLPQVKTLFEQYRTEDTSSIKEELDRSIESARNLGVDPNTVQRVKDLQEKYSAQTDTSVLENQVFSHLTSFFRRYYDKGDFISQRRYKKDVYAIPYEGEEVKLHWANSDQYYIKTSEYFKNYTFKLNDSKKVHFIIEEASTEQNNNIAADNKERKFFIKPENPLSIENSELFIRFHYDVNDEKQKKLNEIAYERVKSDLSSLRGDNLRGTDFNGIFEAKPTQKNPNRTLIEKHLNDYTARNTFDYFIHKDLGGFLKRELDFYIKNEVLYIDDINELDEKQFHKQVATIKVMKLIGQKIIFFLEQLENFQKKLWLKKKFVVETNYCITIDQVPRDLYPEIISNTAQVDEWKKLFNINDIQGDLAREGFSEPLTEKFLQENPFLVLDTKYFSENFQTKLLKSINNLDEQIDGLLIKSENFQALNILLKKYEEQIKCIYIDPPYNTGNDEFIYKDQFRHSSWATLIQNRMNLAIRLLEQNSALFVSIDDNENSNLQKNLNEIFQEDNLVSDICIVNNFSGRSDRVNIATAHEHLLFYQKGRFVSIGLSLPEDYEEQYDRKDETGRRYRIQGLRKRGSGARRVDRPNMYYPFYYDPLIKKLSLVQLANSTPIYPKLSNGEDGRWRWGKETAQERIAELIVQKVQGRDEYDVFQKDFLEIDGEMKRAKAKSFWSDSDYSSDFATTYYKSLVLNYEFKNPKSPILIKDIISLALLNDEICLDFFAGSGTTGDAIITLNRFDKLRRKYILIESGNYFEAVILNRLKKNIYSDEWERGNSNRNNGISHLIKYLRLESYEDTLNNLELSRSQQQQQSLEMNDVFREGYILSYMLDVESEGSSSLLNIEKFEDPFNYYLKITRDNESVPTRIDLVETFNYLIGLVVETIDVLDGYKVITGHNLENEKILIIWRNLREKSNEDLNSFFGRIRVSIHDSEFDQIFINGDNYLENMKIAEEKWKVVLIEEEFKKRMFE